MSSSWNSNDGKSWPSASAGRDSAWSSYQGISRTGRGESNTVEKKNEMNPHPTMKIFVGRLPRNIDRSRILEAFSNSGRIVDLKMPVHDDGTSKGFCFITFESIRDAKWVVIDNYKHNKVDGTWVDCKFDESSPLGSYVAKSSTEGVDVNTVDDKHDDINLQPAMKIFVGRLPWKTDRTSIMDAFSKFGRIGDLKMPVNDDGTSKGYCFITFDSMDDAKWVVIENYKYNKVDGTWVECKFDKSSPLCNYVAKAIAEGPSNKIVDNNHDDVNPQPPMKIFVGRLPWKTDRSSILDAFSKFGRIVDLKMPLNDDGTSKGFCFLTFDSIDTAKWVVIDNYKHNYIGGTWVDCKFDESSPLSKYVANAHAEDSKSRQWQDWWETAWNSNPTCADSYSRVAAERIASEEEPGRRQYTSLPAPSPPPRHPPPGWQEQEPDEVKPEACSREPLAAAFQHSSASSSTALAVRPEDASLPLPLEDQQPRVFLLEPDESSNSHALLAVLVPDENLEVCRGANGIAMQHLHCTPALDIHQEFYYMADRKSWLEQTIKQVGAHFIGATTRFHLASVQKGRFKDWMAVGVGSNSKRVQRASLLALAALTVVSSDQVSLLGVQDQVFALICEHAILHRAALFPCAPEILAISQQPHSSSNHTVVDVKFGSSNDAVVDIKLGENFLTNAVAARGCSIELHMVLQDRAEHKVRISDSFFQWPLPEKTDYLLDELYILRVSGCVVDLRVADPNFWCVVSPCVVEADIDPGSFPVLELKPGDLCKQAYKAAVLSQVGDEDATVLRIHVEPKGWVTLAEWFTNEDGSSVLQSSFLVRCEESAWGPIHAEALPLDYLRELAVEASASFEERQSDVRELVYKAMKDAESGPTILLESAELGLRDKARSDALQCYSEYIDAAKATGVLKSESCRPAGSDREHQAREGLEQKKKLEKGAAFNASDELQTLSETRDRARQARKVARRAECDLLDAYDDGDAAEIADKERIWREARGSAQKADTAFQKKISHFSRICEYLPELQPDILAMTNDHVKKELLAMKPLDQSRVIDLFAMERSLKHYDQQYDKMGKLSRDGARHKVLATSYNGDSCVLKIFELSNPTSVAAFLKEVRLHRKLHHVLVAKLQLAFTDSIPSHGLLGILHFDKYECDLETWGKTRLAQASTPCVAVKRLSCKMVQSVAYIHSMGIVHGDLKPSNWVYDAETDITRLIDFETAKDRGVGGVTATRAQTTAGPQLRTRDYVAPELEADETRPKSRASDIYALGLSIQFLIKCVSSAGSAGHASNTDVQSLTDLVAKMILSDPADRISAQDALNAPAFAIEGGAPLLVNPSKPPVYWACRGQYEWHKSEYMAQECMRLLRQTTCTECRSWGLATNVRITKVCRVENLIHWKSFSGRRAELKERNEAVTRVAHRNLIVGDIQLDNTTNEVFLWHGLPAAKVPMVANSGLDERIANCKGLYGAGIYLTDQWCKALQYSRAGNCSIRYKQCGQKYRCSCVGPKRVLLCRALLGEAYYVKPRDNLKGQRRPPPRQNAGPGVVYDSIIAEPMYSHAFQRKQVHREHVLFDRKSVYPEWIIELDWDT